MVGAHRLVADVCVWRAYAGADWEPPGLRGRRRAELVDVEVTEACRIGRLPKTRHMEMPAEVLRQPLDFETIVTPKGGEAHAGTRRGKSGLETLHLHADLQIDRWVKCLKDSICTLPTLEDPPPADHPVPETAIRRWA